MKQKLIFILLLFKFALIVGMPRNGAYILTSPLTTEESENSPDEDFNVDEVEPNVTPHIKSFHITSNIQFRYAHTVVEAYLANPTRSAKEVTFTVILPEKAFVSNFSMTLKNKEYVAKVEEKSRAAKTYEAAKSQNEFAGIASSDARDVNQISVSVNVEASGKARFRLTYEELLQRHLSRYQHPIHVNLDQVVKDFKVQVNINESLPVIHVRVPVFKTDANSIDTKYTHNKLAQIENNFDGDKTKTRITFQPDVQTQENMQKEKNGKKVIQGQFIVQYDVDRKSEDNHIQIIDGYFVHFFAPQHQESLPKYIVFVLDVSGSMAGEKLKQTKDAMVTILDDLTDQDYFTILTFSDTNKLWVPEAELLQEAPHSLAHQGTKELRAEAIKYVIGLRDLGGTNIHDALNQSLTMVAELKASDKSEYSKLKPLILFMTDGEPTTGITSRSEIEKKIGAANDKLEVPIFGLAFGRGADFNLVKSISVNSGAFARKIYEGLDAALQLEDFYKELANPLLDKVKFDYVGEAFENESITNKDLQTFYQGTEYIIAGQIGSTNEDENIEIIISGEGREGHYNKKLTICRPMPRPLPSEFIAALEGQGTESENNVVDVVNVVDVNVVDVSQLPENCFHPPTRIPRENNTMPNFIERLWAFLTIKDLLDDKMAAKEKRIEELTPKISEERFDDEMDVPYVNVLPSIQARNATTTFPLIIDRSRFVAKKKTREERALEMALKYNFVTKLTSLVITKPSVVEDNLEASSALRTNEETMRLDPTPVSQDGTFEYWRQSNSYSSHARHYMYSMPMGGASRSSNSWASSRSSYGLNIPQGHHKRYPTSASGRRGMAAPAQAPKRLSYALSMSYDNDMEDSDDYQSQHSYSRAAFSSAANSCSGNMTLYNQTYLRGTSIVFDESVENLQNHNFINQVTSMEIEGTCCWRLYTDPLYRGTKREFSPGQYKSATDLGGLFRKIESAQKVECNFNG